MKALLECRVYDPPRRGFIRADRYRVVDLVLEDGRKLEGVHALDDTLLLAPEVEAFMAEDIVDGKWATERKHLLSRPSPRPAAGWTRAGSSGAYQHADDKTLLQVDSKPRKLRKPYHPEMEMERPRNRNPLQGRELEESGRRD